MDDVELDLRKIRVQMWRTRALDKVECVSIAKAAKNKLKEM